MSPSIIVWCTSCECRLAVPPDEQTPFSCSTCKSTFASTEVRDAIRYRVEQARRAARKGGVVVDDVRDPLHSRVEGLRISVDL